MKEFVLLKDEERKLAGLKIMIMHLKEHKKLTRKKIIQKMGVS